MVARCREAIITRRPLLIGVVNAAKIVNLHKDEQLKASLLDCDLVLADGQSVVWASRLLKQPLPERVAGIDLFYRLLEEGDREGWSVYLLGATPEVNTTVTQVVTERWPSVRIAGARNGYFTDEEASAVADDIRAAGADMLFLAMTSPKKEIFLAEYGPRLNVPVIHGVGGSFDVLAGLTTRAPEAWQKLGMEWAYRLAQEPTRLWRRYLVTNTSFIAMVGREWRDRAATPESSAPRGQ